MGKFIVATFLMLGWAFYELSGGSDFVPETRAVAEADQVEVAPVEEVIADAAPEPVEEPQVTRAATSTLVSFETLAPADETVTEEAEVLAALEEAVTAVDPSPEVAVIEAEPATLDIREVAGSRVNMRSGPGTNYDVLATLTLGTQTEVIEVDSTGWARLRVVDTGQIGWMAERLLTDG